VADSLRAHGAAVEFVGSANGIEARLVPQSGYKLHALPLAGLAGGPAARARAGALFLKAIARCRNILKTFRPGAVLGVGGYAGGPVVLLAALQRVPTVILEPNAKPGFTNRVLRPFVDRCACSYPEAAREFGAKGVITGNPVRGGFATLPRKEHREPYTVLVFGGSQGSRILNRAMVAALPGLPGPARLRIVHQTGEAMRDEVAQAYAAAGREAEVTAFLDDMEARFGAADLVVSRSGATTCAELTAAGKASVLVPFAQAADDHQRSNARAMEAAGAGRMVEEKDLTGERLAAAIDECLADPQRLRAMEDAARALGKADAAARVADLLESA
jgi:UDP-N-acetylglucosamine--N-acetylmuramyl-(pentapeptide) pyrophosphoryl-undecaprenol N-acetylglucosamine transferase